jgi:hypothetical protein
MRTRYGLIGAVIAGLMVAGVVAATSATAPKVTGGGQTLNGSTGAGDTIAFTAQGEGEDVRGQVQYVDRTDSGQTVRHGAVTCLVYEGSNQARLGGEWRGGGTFEILVRDNGEGNGTQDQIGVYPDATPDCGPTQNEDDDATVALARGNAQVHPAD